VKNTMEAPVSTPENPCGENGVQLPGLIARYAPRQKIAMARILMKTIAVLVSALSFTPRTRIHVTASVMSRAGMLKIPCGSPGAGKCGYAIAAGSCTPNRFFPRSWRYAENPTATDMLETAYSRIRSHPMIQAKISPRIA
jgi:hypothetical protein